MIDYVPVSPDVLEGIHDRRRWCAEASAEYPTLWHFLRAGRFGHCQLREVHRVSGGEIDRVVVSYYDRGGKPQTVVFRHIDVCKVPRIGVQTRLSTVYEETSGQDCPDKGPIFRLR